MMRVIVAVDGSPNSERAVRYLIRWMRGAKPVEVHLLNVQEPVDSLEVRRFKLPRDIRRLQRRRGVEQLRAARALLDKARIPYEAHALIGRVAETIIRFARRRRCDTIIMGTRGMTALANLLLGSVATKVIHLARMPVTLVKQTEDTARSLCGSSIVVLKRHHGPDSTLARTWPTGSMALWVMILLLAYLLFYYL